MMLCPEFLTSHPLYDYTAGHTPVGVLTGYHTVCVRVYDLRHQGKARGLTDVAQGQLWDPALEAVTYPVDTFRHTLVRVM